MDKRIFRASEVEPNGSGWIVDLSTDVVNPDFYWRFKSRKTAERFVVLVDSGVDPRQAIHELERHPSGTAPDTSLWLGATRRAWLQNHGGIQPTIQRLIDETMEAIKTAQS